MDFFRRVLTKAAGRNKVETGDEISVSVDLALGHDGSAEKFLSAWPSNAAVAQPAKTVFAVDHLLPAPSIRARELHRKLHEFARQQHIHLFDRGEGVLHQVVAERFTPQPGWILAGADGHVATAGAFGSLAFSISPEELVSVLMTGALTLKVPPVYIIEVTDSLPSAVTGCNSRAASEVGRRPEEKGQAVSRPACRGISQSEAEKSRGGGELKGSADRMRQERSQNGNAVRRRLLYS